MTVDGHPPSGCMPTITRVSYHTSLGEHLKLNELITDHFEAESDISVSLSVLVMLELTALQSIFEASAAGS